MICCRTGLYHAVLLFLLGIGGSFQSACGQDVEPDPTIPSLPMREKLAPPVVAPLPQTTAPANGTRSPTPTISRVRQIKIKSLVLGLNREATVVLAIEGQGIGGQAAGSQSVSLALPADLYRKQVQIPKNQFKDPQPASKTTTGEETGQGEGDSGEGEASDGESIDEVSLAAMFNPQTIQVDGRLLTCVSFHENLLVFRDVDTGRLLLAR